MGYRQRRVYVASGSRRKHFKALVKGFRPESLDGASVAVEELTDSVEASAAYRAHLIGVMARRAVMSAVS